MREHCELCGEWAVCEDGLCNECVEELADLIGDDDETSEEREGEDQEGKEGKAENPGGSSVPPAQV